ncbi:alpha-galactosidase [uncultured Microbacterium sp.]|uniref:alpha-galactosidase n=1 Tax=uncultured Microbacterium sp. TaxID=191216 RepID=UPI0026115D8B|nr:alpha-galactosidase [uncultured Microbacterium sp.]
MIHHLHAAGVSLVLDSRGAAVPAIVHWGRGLGALTEAQLTALADAQTPAIGPSSLDVPLRLSLVPALADGWSGRPGVALAGGIPASPRAVSTTRDGDALTIVVAWGDAIITTVIALSPEGVLTQRTTVRNSGSTPLSLTSAAAVLPVPARAREVLDFSGRWVHEREPQRLAPGHGVWLRETRHGRGGHDAPFLMAAGTPGFDFDSGEVWATHVAWSGDVAQWFERTDLGPTVLGAGERLEDVVLAPDAVHESPEVVAVWSDAGLNGLSDRLHPWIRSWSTIARPRPVTLNTWEAVYFDQSLERLTALADRAAEVGVERFVLDDGWFLGRTDDKRALGDWIVDPERWPDGLGPLIDRVVGAGMEFGLWVEPEMISADSELARAHPDWLLTDAASPTWRWQHVIDLAQPAVAEHLFARIEALLSEYPISHLKWDHNRDVLVPDSGAQTRALYALLDRIRAAHPQVEIESCASGGGRIDLGILRRVERVWTSDTNDPLDRQRIQRWTGILVPPEYLGSHLGDAKAHVTGRTSSLGFRFATALFGHAGIESDLTLLPDDDLRLVRGWIDVHKQHRALLHGGRVLQIGSLDPAVIAHGVVAADRSSALFSYAVIDRTDAALPALLRLVGLDAERIYAVRQVDLGVTPHAVQDAPPPWLATGVRLPGRVLGEIGLPMPLLTPGEAVVLQVTAA